MMYKLRKLNSRARRAGFTTTQILTGYAIVFAAVLVIMFATATFLLNTFEEVKASELERLEITQEEAAFMAKNRLGKNFKVVGDPVEVEHTDNRGNNSYIVELRFETNKIISANTEFVLVSETGISDKPVKIIYITEKDARLKIK